MDPKPHDFETGDININIATPIHIIKPDNNSTGILRLFVANVSVVLFGTKLCVLLPVILLAFVAKGYGVGNGWIFCFSLIGLAPLAERVSFLTEQIAYFTGPIVGGLLNATCGNATELIIALFALHQRKINVLKYSLFGSIISNLLLVLGSSLFCGGVANLNKKQRFDKKQVDANSLLLLLGLLCQIMPLLFTYGGTEAAKLVPVSAVKMSRASSIVMLLAYAAYINFQLKTQSHVFELQEIASDTWGNSVSIISIILLPIVGNAAEHACAIIFAFKNKLDISLGVAMGSATQISTFLVPLCVVVSWIMGIPMSLDFGVLQTGCLAFSILLTTITLQDGSSHYLKGLILVLAYVVIGACFFVQYVPYDQSDTNDLGIWLSSQELGISSG